MALSDDRITALGDELFTALRTRSVLSPLTARETDIDIDDAYRISLRFLERRTADGETLIGKKIGVTSKPVQDMLGVHQPDFGFLTNRMQVANGAVVSIARASAARDTPIQPARRRRGAARPCWRADALSSVNRAASCSVIAPASSSASTMVTARR